VVGAGGKMVGFGGGIPRKRHLLELEARVSFESLWS
jgi:methylated-DNA-[protein]-cysteine S-methyltransferase